MEQRIISRIFGLLVIIQHISGDDLGLLSSTLRAFRQMSCEDELMVLSCPIGTSISVEVVQYGRKEENSSLQCSSTGSLESRYPFEATTLTSADMPFILGNMTFSLMEVGFNESVLPERTKSKCTQNYVLQYSILQIVVEACQKKRKCSFRATPKTFDSAPCSGIHKLVEVSHKCRPFEFRSLIACEKDVIRLACGRYTRIAIYSASYGRTAYESSSHCAQPAGSKEETCLSTHTSLTLTEICQGRRKCTVAVEGSTFGQPCPDNVRVSLKVVYACVARNVFRDRYITPLEDDELDQQFELNELYDDEFTPAPNQVDGSSGGQMSHKFSDELEATVKAENILTQSMDDAGTPGGGDGGSSIDSRLLVIIVVIIFFGCCLAIGALVAYKMRLLSSTESACIKHSDSSEPQSNTNSIVPSNEDFDLVECVAETIPVAVKRKQPNFEHPSTSAAFLPTFKVFNHPDAVPQISTTMFILPNYIVSEANLQSNKSGLPKPAENLSLTITDVTGGSTPGDPFPQAPSAAASERSCVTCNFLGWQATTVTAGTTSATGLGGAEQRLALRHNQSFKMPETERKICQNDSFLWVGLRLGVM